MLKLKNIPKVKEIPIKDLPIGKIAIITSWGYEIYIGIIVQKIEGGDVIALGRTETWGSYCGEPSTNKVRILEIGEELIIE